jgi:hypothetical protein
MGRSWADHRLGHVRRAAVGALVLFGQLIGAIGLPLPTASPPDVAQAAARPQRPCCACGVACGESCCCSKPKVGKRPVAAPLADSWRWVPGVQARQCRGDDPDGLTSLPPALPVTRPASWTVDPPAGRFVRLSGEFARSVPLRPPFPPPRLG